MNLFIRWCFRIGLVCGVGFLLSAVLISLEDFGLTASATVRSLAEDVGTLLGLIFMLLGFVLLPRSAPCGFDGRDCHRLESSSAWWDC